MSVDHNGCKWKLTVEPPIGKIRLGSLVEWSPPQRRCASSGLMKERSRAVGIRSAILSGELRAGKPVEVMSLMSGKDSGFDVITNNVPSAIYRFRNMVQPGAWLMSSV